MNHSIGKLLPVDGYRLSKNGDLPKNAHQSLSHLYQPIIGRLAVSLYQVLVSECEMLPSREVQSHHTLMSYLSVPLDKIYESRKKLEAIGLLRTFHLNDDERQTEYLYLVNPPFSPEEFFLDNMLSLLLYHELGADKYQRLKTRLIKKEVALDNYEEVTASFDEVFHSVTKGPMPLEANAQSEKSLVRQEPGPVLHQNRVDFEWLTDALKKKNVSE